MLRQRPHGKSRGEVGTTRQWRLRDGVTVWPGCIMTTVLADKASVCSRAWACFAHGKRMETSWPGQQAEAMKLWQEFLWCDLDEGDGG